MVRGGAGAWGTGEFAAMRSGSHTCVMQRWYSIRSQQTLHSTSNLDINVVNDLDGQAKFSGFVKWDWHTAHDGC